MIEWRERKGGCRWPVLAGEESPSTTGRTGIRKDAGRELRLWHRNETALRKCDDAERLTVTQHADETAKPCGCKPK